MIQQGKLWWKSRTNVFAVLLGTVGTALASTPLVRDFLATNIETAPPVLTLLIAVVIIAFRSLTTEPVRLT